MDTHETIIDRLLYWSKETPTKQVLNWFVDNGEVVRTLTYEQLLAECQKVAADIIGLGAKPGDRVMLCYPAGLDFIIAFLGCLMAHTIAVPVSPPKPSRLEEGHKRLHFLMTECSCKLFLTNDEEIRLTSAPFFNDVTASMDVKVLTTNHNQTALTASHEEAAIQNETNQCESSENDADSIHEGDTSLPDPPEKGIIAMLQYSSGSTGMPKGIIIAHSNMMENLARFHETAKFDPSSVEISWLPHFHDMGLDLAYLITIYSGCTGYFTSPQHFVLTPSLWLTAVSMFGGTHTAVPNFAMELVIKRGFPEKLDLSTLQCISIGAEPTHHQTLEKFHKTFHPFGLKSVYNSIYGLAEHVVLLTSRPAEADLLYRKEEDWVSCGPPLKGITIKVVDPDTREPLPDDGAVGEIWATSEHKPEGYWDKPELSKSTFHAELVPSDGQGYLRTGDLGFIKNGEIYISGRMKDLIIINGRNIYPNDVEYHVESEFKIFRPGCSAAFPVTTTPSSGEDIAMVAEILDIDNRSTIELHCLGSAVAQEVALQFQARVASISMIPPRTIPKTTSGKIRRNQCKKEAESSPWKPVHMWTLEDDLEASDFICDPVPMVGIQEIKPSSVASVIGYVLGKTIQEDTNFWSFGCNSLKAAEIMEEILNTFGAEVPVHRLYACKTPTEVCMMLKVLPDSSLSDCQETTDGVSTTDHKESVVVVGMGCRFPGANSPSDFWKLLMNKTDTSVRIRLEDDANLSGCFTTAAHFFDYNWFGLSEEKASCLDPHHSLLLHTANSALMNSGYDTTAPLNERIGVFVGMSGSECALKEGLKSGPFFSETHPHCMAANIVSYYFGLTGPSFTVDASCSSSLGALSVAMNALKLGQCEAAIVAGVSVMLVPEVMQVNKLVASSDTKSQPFHADGQGYVRGEGCGAVVLKLSSQAQKDGDRIVSCVKSCVTNNCGNTLAGFTVPSAISEVSVMREALEASHVDPSDVAFVEAHAGGIPDADIIEVESIAQVYKREEEEKFYVSSAKGNIGHLEAAAGMAGLVKAILSLEHSTIPPVVNLDRPHPMLPDSITIPTEPVQLQQCKGNSGGSPVMLSAGITTLSLGGSSSHAIVQQVSSLPDMKRTSVGVVIALETTSPPGAQMFENVLMQMRALGGFLGAENEVYSQIVTFYGQHILPKMDSIHPVLLEFVFVHCVLKTLSDSGVSFCFISSVGPLSEVLAAVHADMLSLRDGIAIVLSKINPDLQAGELKRSVHANPSTVPFYSPSQGQLLASQICGSYVSALTKLVWERNPSAQKSVEETLGLTAFLEPVVTIGLGSSGDLEAESGGGGGSAGVHVFSPTTVPTVQRLREAMLELRYHHDAQFSRTRPEPLETAPLPGIYDRFPLRQTVTVTLEENDDLGELSSFSPPSAPRRRSSSIYSDLAMRVLTSSSLESSNNSITYATLNMDKDQRLLFLIELVCLTAQEVLGIDLLDISIPETQDLAELGIVGEVIPEFLDMVQKRTGVKLAPPAMKDMSPALLSEVLLKQLYPGVAEREEETSSSLTAAKADYNSWGNAIMSSLYIMLSRKYPNLLPMEEAVRTDIFALGIQSLELLLMGTYIQDVYDYPMSVIEMKELSTLEAMAATISKFLANTKVSIYPRLTKEGYSVYPPMTEILTMGTSAVAKISGFSIMREGIGKIEFIGKSDLTGIDLDKVVIIDAGEVTVYPSGTSVPPHGCGLNRPAIVTFRNIHPRKSTLEGYDRMERRLKKNCEEKELIFIAYDYPSGDFIFKVNGF